MEESLYLQLYMRQARIIFLYLLKHGCNKQDAEDIVQESFIKLLEYRFDIQQGKEASWLFKVALNDFRNRCKKQLIHGELILDEMAFVKGLQEEEPEQQLLFKEKSNEIMRCLSMMKEKHRDLLILKYEMNLSYRQIAQLLDTKEEQVKIYLYRSRNIFKKLWEDSHG